MNIKLREQIESFVPLTDAEFDLVSSYFAYSKFSKHQFLVREESFVANYYFILSGLTKSFFTDDSGTEHILDFAMDNSWVTDLRAFHLQEKSMMNIYCLEDCETLIISFENLEKLCRQLDKMQYFFRQKAMDENILLQRRIQCFLTNNAVNRYHELVSRNPDLVQRVPKKLIASYLGVSRETLSRLPVMK